MTRCPRQSLALTVLLATTLVAACERKGPEEPTHGAEPAKQSAEPAKLKSTESAETEAPKAAVKAAEPAAEPEPEIAAPAPRATEPTATVLQKQLLAGDATLAGTELWQFIDPTTSRGDEPPPIVTHHCGAAAQKEARAALTGPQDLELELDDIACAPCGKASPFASEGCWACRWNGGHFSEEVAVLRPVGGELRLVAMMLEGSGFDEEEPVNQDFVQQQKAAYAELTKRLQSDTCP